MITAKDAHRPSEPVAPADSALEIVQKALRSLPPIEDRLTDSVSAINARTAALELMERAQRIRRLGGLFGKIEVSAYVDALAAPMELPS